MPQPVWLVEGLFEKGSLIMLAGPSYSFKSFMLLDWLCNMAAGRDWKGRKTLPSKVAYALGEGKASLLKRIHAWIVHNNITDAEKESLAQNFRVTFEVPQLGSKASTDNFLADIEASGFKPDVIAVDTFARSFVGLDENDAKDTGLWVESADRLRQLGYSVIFLHHTKKNTEFGVQYRGSTAIMGAMDTAMTLVREKEFVTLTVTKQKDHDEGQPMRFRRRLVEDSCVLDFQPLMDSRFAGEDGPVVALGHEWQEEEVQPLDSEGTKLLMERLIANPAFASDAERAREMSLRTGLSEDACKARISRGKR